MTMNVTAATVNRAPSRSDHKEDRIETKNAGEKRLSFEEFSSKARGLFLDLKETRIAKIKMPKKSKTSPQSNPLFPQKNIALQQKEKPTPQTSSKHKERKRQQHKQTEISQIRKACAVIALPVTIPASLLASSSNQRQRRRKRVHWSKNIRVKVTHNVDYYTRQERRDTWFSTNEYSRMEYECEVTSMHMDEMIDRELNLSLDEPMNGKPKTSLPPGFCERGLESWTRRGEKLKSTRVEHHIDTVWQAQIDAWAVLDARYSSSKSKTIDDKWHEECWECIRRKSIMASAHCSVIAVRLALNDEKAIIPYLNTTRSKERARRAASMTGEQHDRKLEDSSASKFENIDLTNHFPNTNSILKRSAPMRSRPESHTAQNSYFDSANSKDKTINPPRRRRNQVSYSRGEGSSDSISQRPVRVVSPATASKFIQKDNFDHGLPFGLTSSGAKGADTDEWGAKAKISGGTSEPLNKNSTSSHRSHNSTSSHRRTEKKIQLQSKNKTKMPPSPLTNIVRSTLSTDDSVDNESGTTTPGAASSITSTTSTTSRKNKTRLQYKSKTQMPKSTISSDDSLENESGSSRTARSTTSASSRKQKTELQSKDNTKMPKRRISSDDSLDNESGSSRTARSTTSASSRKQKTELQSKSNAKMPKRRISSDGSVDNESGSSRTARSTTSASSRKKTTELQSKNNTKMPKSRINSDDSVDNESGSSRTARSTTSASSRKKKTQLQSKSKTKMPKSRSSDGSIDNVIGVSRPASSSSRKKKTQLQSKMKTKMPPPPLKNNATSPISSDDSFDNLSGTSRTASSTTIGSGGASSSTIGTSAPTPTSTSSRKQKTQLQSKSKTKMPPPPPLKNNARSRIGSDDSVDNESGISRTASSACSMKTKTRLQSKSKTKKSPAPLKEFLEKNDQFK
eukprot:jgi/Psemu1/287809/fgenesh1_pg.215_\